MSDPLFFVVPLFMSLSLLLLQLPTGRNLRRPEAILGGAEAMGKIDDRHLPHLKLTAIFAPENG